MVTLEGCKVLVWDEAIISHKLALEAVEACSAIFTGILKGFVKKPSLLQTLTPWYM